MSSDVEILGVVGVVLGFLDGGGGRIPNDLSDVDVVEAMSAVGEARHPWRTARVRIREARGSRASLPAQAS